MFGPLQTRRWLSALILLFLQSPGGLRRHSRGAGGSLSWLRFSKQSHHFMWQIHGASQRVRALAWYLHCYRMARESFQRWSLCMPRLRTATTTQTTLPLHLISLVAREHLFSLQVCLHWVCWQRVCSDSHGFGWVSVQRKADKGKRFTPQPFLKVETQADLSLFYLKEADG